MKIPPETKNTFRFVKPDIGARPSFFSFFFLLNF